MSERPKVAAHLILGAREEPFLEALLRSLEGVADEVIINDNGGQAVHDATLGESAFGRGDRLHVDRTPFTDFASARNACLAAHERRAAGEWVAFVDADEVHAATARNISANLGEVPRDVDFVDGYTWHFFPTPHWYLSIERRLSFFRFRSGVRWVKPVHEQLEGLSGRRVALPYVYAHYGHILTARRAAEKGRLYSRLGAPGDVVSEDRLDRIDPERYYAEKWARALAFRSRHPPCAIDALERLSRDLAEQYAVSERLVRYYQSGAATRSRNRLAQTNFELRWRGRAADPLARRLCRTP